MAVSLEGLEPKIYEMTSSLLDSLKSAGVEMRPCVAIRTPTEQAKLWRQSRSIEEIVSAIARLRNGGASYLAHVVDAVGPQHGPPVTQALPGLSWHQWGEAVDCFWAVNGGAEWSTSKILDGINGYKIYASRAKEFGLVAGGLWRSFKDWPHVQLRQQGSPTAAGYSLAEIDKAMKTRFG